MCERIGMGINELICDMLEIDKCDNNVSLFKYLSSYELLYVLEYIEKQFKVSISEIFRDLEYSDMTINTLSTKIQTVMGRLNETK